MNFFQELIIEHLPYNKRLNNRGWYTFNCPCCIYNGEKRDDTKHRGNFMLTPDGGWVYSCYNCKFKTAWKPGSPITKKTKEFLEEIGIDQNTIKELSFKIHELGSNDIKIKYDKKTFTTQKKIQLPKDAKKINDLIREKFDNKDFLLVASYIFQRDKNLFNYYDFYWSEEYPHGFIIPCWYKNECWGYIVRNINITPKYIKKIPEGFLFGIDNIFKDRKNIIVTEGTLDAICIQGVGVGSNELSKEQLYWLNIFKDKKVIILPDRDEPGKKLIEQALENGWSVSFPEWGEGIKDAADAVKKYGRILTLKKIFDSTIDDEFKIKLTSKLWS